MGGCNRAKGCSIVRHGVGKTRGAAFLLLSFGCALLWAFTAFTTATAVASITVAAAAFTAFAVFTRGIVYAICSGRLRGRIVHRGRARFAQGVGLASHIGVRRWRLLFFVAGLAFAAEFTPRFAASFAVFTAFWALGFAFS
jgi:hypothetical protein